MRGKIKQTIFAYPKTFWVLVFASFIDNIGGFLLFPFFAIYVTDKFNVGMTEVGLIFTFFSVGGIIGGIIGGIFTDKYGRRITLLLGLITSGLGSIAMGYIENLNFLYIVSIIVGILSNVGSPAQNAMVADLLPIEKQADGYGIIRVAVNLSATIGPAIGGLLISFGFRVLFYGDAISSLITAVIVILVIPETIPQNKIGTKKDSLWLTLKGFTTVLKDGVFMFFILISIFVSLAYMQINSTLSVYLRDGFDFPESQYGLMLSMNALMVVLFQFPITRKISKYNPFVMMLIGTGLYAIGLIMYGFVGDFYLFYIAMIIITIGEMIVAPFGQYLVSKFSPEDKRGRYMAMYGFSWMIPSLFGILIAGLIMDYADPAWIWYIAGILCLIAMFGYLILMKFVKSHPSDDGKMEK